MRTWKREKKYQFMKYRHGSVVVHEGYRNILVSRAWGRGRASRQQRYWRVYDEQPGKTITIGDPEGYVRLCDAKDAANQYLDNIEAKVSA